MKPILLNAILLVVASMLGMSTLLGQTARPTFEVQYINTELIELTTTLEKADSVYHVQIVSLSESEQQPFLRELTVRLVNGKAVNHFLLTDYPLLENAGRLLIKFRKADTLNTPYSDTTIVLRDMHNLYTDLGVRFKLQKGGVVKGYPVISIAGYSKLFQSVRWFPGWLRLSDGFAEMYLDALSPVDSSGLSNIDSIFIKGGMTVDAQIGLLLNFYNGWEQEVITPFLAYGGRSDVETEFTWKHRGSVGLTFNLFPLTGDYNNGFIDVAYSYDSFWSVKDTTNALIEGYTPHRFLLKAHYDFVIPKLDMDASLEFKGDIGLAQDSKSNLGLVIVVSYDVAEFVGGLFNTLTSTKSHASRN